MIKNSDDIVYNSLKNKIGFDRAKNHLQWVGKNNPGKQLHHLFGSYSQSLKTSDYAVVPVTAEEHQKAEKDKSGFAIEKLPVLFNILVNRIKFLESQLKGKK